MIVSRAQVLALVTLSASISQQWTVHAFVRLADPAIIPQPQQTVRGHRSQLFGMPMEYRPPSEDEDADDAEANDSAAAASAEGFDIESERKRLESMLGTASTDDASGNCVHDVDFIRDLIDPTTEIDLPTPPPMTSIDRDRRMAEMKFLEDLQDGDEAMQSLWHLWFFERGSDARAELEQADQLMSSANPFLWAQCEAILTNLIKEYGVYWVEPVNRLATLYFLQGRFEQSLKLCKVVLEIKPWHFGALSGIVMVCIKMNRRDEARRWADRRLPTMVANSSFPPFENKAGPTNPRRADWVERSVIDANAALLKAEKQTKKSFGKPEDYYSTGSTSTSTSSSENKNEGLGNSLIKDDESGDSWQ